MDPLSALLRGPRAVDAFVLKVVMEPPWAIEIRDQAELTVVAVLEGEALTATADGRSQLLTAGQVGLVRGPEPYRCTDRGGSPTQIFVNPGHICEDIHGRQLIEPFMRGVRTWGNDPAGSTVMVIGTYERVGAIGTALLGSLPLLAAIDGSAIALPVVELIATELTKEGPGQAVVLDRLLDLLTVSALRAYLDQAGVDAPGWWEASADPVVGDAITLLCNNPAHSWTVASLAGEVGVSRASLARRFTDLVGQPPMTFLSEWRIAMGAELLLKPEATVTAVAAELGYASPFAFSTAFKRQRGISPSKHRQEARLSA